MLLNKNGQKITLGNTCYYIGQEIIANADSEYAGLLGVITEIRTGKHRATDNETADIYCDFVLPENDYMKTQLERRFCLFIEDIALEGVIMSPEIIEPKMQYQINLAAQPLYVLSYTLETDDDFNSFVLCASGSIDTLKRIMREHIKTNPHFENTDIIASDDFNVCEYDTRSVPDDGKRYVWMAEKDYNYYKYVISETPYIHKEVANQC